MTLLHPGILLGLALVTVPVIVHLLMRQKPKKLVFPALRLLQHRRKQNSRRLRLRHIWLLLLRMLAIGLLVFAISRPTLPAANFALTRREWITMLGVVAIAIGVYAFILRRWRQTLPGFMYATKRSSLRGWTTGATLLALLLLVGWPYQRRVAAEMTAPAPDARIDVPVAAVCLFDTSLSMGYLQAGESRLDVARRIAREHIGSLPDGSRIAIADDASDNPVVFQSTLGTALARIDDLELHPATLPLNDRLRTTLLAQRDDRKQQLDTQADVKEEARLDRYVRRVYVFTDLAQSAWRGSGLESLQAELEKLENVPVFLVDVGELQPQNSAVTAVNLSRQRVSKGGSLIVGAAIDSIGLPPGERDVEMWYTDGNRPKVGPLRRSVSLESGARQNIEFDLVPSLAGPVVQGEVRLVSSDPLAADDVRYFTADVGEPPKVLIVAPTQAQARFWTVTLNPEDEARFDTSYILPKNLGEIDLEPFDAVCLINVSQPTDEEWRRLARYVDGGGGLAIFLGSMDDSIRPDYRRATAQSFLPGLPDVHSVKGNWRMSLEAIDHPLFRKVREHTGSRGVLENELEVFRFWKVEPSADATVLARYTDDARSPAILLRNHGQGRVLMFTTAVDAKPSRGEWNTLTNLVNTWAWLALAQPVVDYLARLSDAQFTVDAGEAVTLPLKSDDAALLRRPNLTQTTRSPKPGSKQLVVSDASLVGHYTVAPAGGGPALAGFSINPPAGESDFTRFKGDQLDEMFGKDRYQVARNIDELKSDVNLADLGKEVFSVLMVLVICAFVGEHLVANRFYESEQDEGRIQDSGFGIQGNVLRASERTERVTKAEVSAR